MIPTKNERYPNAAKVILVLFVIFMALGPSMLRSADKKTRAHFTARDGRSTEEVQSASEAMTTSTAQDSKAVQKAFEEEARIRAELEKRIEAEERRAEKDLEKRIEEEERLARKELKKRLDAEERAATVARKNEFESVSAASEKTKPWYNPIGWRSPFASKGPKVVRKVREDEIRIRAELEKRIAEKERIAEKDLEKRIEEEERLARNELNKRLEEKERIVVAARENQLEDGLVTSKNANPWYNPVGWRSPFEKKEFKGYLAYREPAPLRFSNEYMLSDRTLSPALPEFTMMTQSQEPLLVETRLSEQEIYRNELLRQVVVKMDPHTIVSGRIDTSIPRSQVEGPRFEIEENSDAVVRKEEVLIFFENQRADGNGRTIVPFSPALPAQLPPVDSKANYRIER